MAERTSLEFAVLPASEAQEIRAAIERARQLVAAIEGHAARMTLPVPRRPVRRDLAPGYTSAVLDCDPHESAEAARREEERLRRTWTVQPESRRAAHLVRPAEELARQIQRAVGGGR